MEARTDGYSQNYGAILCSHAVVQYHPTGSTVEGSGIFDAEETVCTIGSFIPKGVHWLKSAVAALDPEKEAVILRRVPPGGEIQGWSCVRVSSSVGTASKGWSRSWAALVCCRITAMRYALRLETGIGPQIKAGDRYPAAYADLSVGGSLEA
jgi:hypothetical protein